MAASPGECKIEDETQVIVQHKHKIEDLTGQDETYYRELLSARPVLPKGQSICWNPSHSSEFNSFGVISSRYSVRGIDASEPAWSLMRVRLSRWQK